MTSRVIPLAICNPRLAENLGKEMSGDISPMRIRDMHFTWPFHHKQMTAAGVRAVKTKTTEFLH